MLRFGQHKCDYFTTTGKDGHIKYWDSRMLALSGNTQSVEHAKPVPVWDLCNHESVGYQVQSDFICRDSYLVTGSASNRAYVYSLQTGSLVEMVQTELSPVVLVVGCPEVSPFAFTFTGMNHRTLYLADVGQSDATYAEKQIPIYQIETDDLAQEQMMRMLVKHSRLMVRLAQDHDLIVSAEGFEAMLEILLTLNDPEMVSLRRDLLDSFNTQATITDAEVQIRRKLDAQKIILACQQCNTCDYCQRIADAVPNSMTAHPNRSLMIDPHMFEWKPTQTLHL